MMAGNLMKIEMKKSREGMKNNIQPAPDDGDKGFEKPYRGKKYNSLKMKRRNGTKSFRFHLSHQRKGFRLIKTANYTSISAGPSRAVE